MNSLQLFRKQNGLCMNCGETAIPGRTRCVRCAQIQATKARDRYHHTKHTKKYKAARSVYERKWRENNPDRMEVYKSRKSEYNRRYNENIW